jgi:membrane associated rhomboid family serine protease
MKKSKCGKALKNRVETVKLCQMLDDRSYMRTPYRPAWSMTTILLISVFACFLAQRIAQGVWSPDWVDDWFALSTQGLKDGKVYQLLTFQFMHASWFHLFGNMIGLYFFGRAVEETLGRMGLLRLYLLSGTVGGLLQITLAFVFPGYFVGGVVGASAGVFGLIAAFATRAPDQPITMFFYFFPVTFKARVLLIFEGSIALLGLLGPLIHFTAFTGNIAHAAHLGGMITGIFYIRWSGWAPRAFEFWRPFARRAPAPKPKRELVSTVPRRAWQSARKPMPDLPPAEFISREVDPILEKISAHGIHSLTEHERQVLEAARNKMAKR